MSTVQKRAAALEEAELTVTQVRRWVQYTLPETWPERHVGGEAVNMYIKSASDMSAGVGENKGHGPCFVI